MSAGFSRPLTAPDADPQIQIRLAGVGQPVIGIDAQADLRETFGKVRNAVHKPASREDGGDRDGQQTVVAALGKCYGAGEVTHTIAQAGEDFSRRLDRDHAATGALKKRAAELLFGLDHLLAHGPDRHTQFFRRRLQRAEARNGFDGTQAVQMYLVEAFHAGKL